MNIFNNYFKLTVVLIAFSFFSCKKGWLDEKPVQSLVVPTTVKDFQSLLDNTDIFNISYPILGELGSDDYYLTYSVYQARPGQEDRNEYSWANVEDFYAGKENADWTQGYTQIYYANIVLEGSDKIIPTQSNYSDWANVKGSAFFYRAYSYYNLAQIFCKPYIEATATTDLGLIVRIQSDINIPSARSSVKQTYEQIINDLLDAKPLLPQTAAYKTRPSRLAVFAMLSRIYLSMGKYDKALEWSDSCLITYNALMNYKNDPVINATSTSNPFPNYPSVNPEVIFHSRMLSPNLTPKFTSGVSYVDTSLFQLYDPNDLRKQYFFKTLTATPPRLAFTGSYNAATAYFFNGLATDEIYLNRAECYARKGDKTLALADLNSVYQKRWNSSFAYPTITANDAEEALRKILIERRKELCFRGIRWTDLRRLNQDSRFAITITHGLLGAPTPTIFTLPPNDNRYVYPIPNSEILYSHVPQNPR